MAEKTITGACACRTVRFTLSGHIDDIVACHCESCRRQSGHIVAATRLRKNGLTINAGEDAIHWWWATDEARRGFCSVCGSLLFWEAEGSEKISVMAGALDTPTELQMVRHIYVAEKGDYYTTNDGLPVFEHSD